MRGALASAAHVVFAVVRGPRHPRGLLSVPRLTLTTDQAAEVQPEKGKRKKGKNAGKDGGEGRVVAGEDTKATNVKAEERKVKVEERKRVPQESPVKQEEDCPSPAVSQPFRFIFFFSLRCFFFSAHMDLPA